jgi:hypothetical protein
MTPGRSVDVSVAELGQPQPRFRRRSLGNGRRRQGRLGGFVMLGAG